VRQFSCSCSRRCCSLVQRRRGRGGTRRSTWENYRADAGKFPRSVLGKSNGWPGERWLDIRRLRVLEPIMTARMRMCRSKGFDALEPDNIDGYANRTGFPLTAREQLTYHEWVAREAHELGLAVFQKNDPEQARELEPHFDGVLDEQCNQYSECSSSKPYLAAGKPVERRVRPPEAALLRC
jgi:hypothetical protein